MTRPETAHAAMLRARALFESDADANVDVVRKTVQRETGIRLDVNELIELRGEVESEIDEALEKVPLPALTEGAREANFLEKMQVQAAGILTEEATARRALETFLLNGPTIDIVVARNWFRSNFPAVKLRTEEFAAVYNLVRDANGQGYKARAQFVLDGARAGRIVSWGGATTALQVAMNVVTRGPRLKAMIEREAGPEALAEVEALFADARANGRVPTGKVAAKVASQNAPEPQNEPSQSVNLDPIGAPPSAPTGTGTPTSELHELVSALLKVAFVNAENMAAIRAELSSIRAVLTAIREGA